MCLQAGFQQELLGLLKDPHPGLPPLVTNDVASPSAQLLGRRSEKLPEESGHRSNKGSDRPGSCPLRARFDDLGWIGVIRHRRSLLSNRVIDAKIALRAAGYNIRFVSGQQSREPH